MNNGNNREAGPETAPAGRRCRGASLLTLAAAVALAALQPAGAQEPAAVPAEPGDRALADRFDRDAPPETKNQLTPSLFWGGRLELEYNVARNFDLNGNRDDRTILLVPDLRLALSYQPTRDFQAFISAELLRQFALDEPRSRNRDWSLEVKQAYLLFRNVVQDRLDVGLGRQRFKDDREWVYDADLDALRFLLRAGEWTVDVSASREAYLEEDLLQADSEEDQNNYIVYLKRPLGSRRSLAAYWLLRDHDSSAGESPIFWGVHATGDITPSLDYWLEAAVVRGRDGPNKIRGWGGDLGGTWRFDLPLRPNVTLGYAYGSGDENPNDGTDGNFRQTGLNDNNARFAGVTKFKYYGEMFQPELSNMHIFTAGVGLRPISRTSVDLVYHWYEQDEARNRIRDSDLAARPNGLSRKLGSEIDLVVGYRGKGDPKLALELVMGYFMPGAAFSAPADADAFFGKFEIKYSF